MRDFRFRFATVPALVAVIASLACGSPPSRTETMDQTPGGDAGRTADTIALGDSAMRADTPVAADTAAAQDYGALALVEFADSLRTSDLEWLRQEGFKIVEVFEETSIVTVRIPLGYGKDPMEINPRIVRFQVRTIPPPPPDTNQT